MTIPPAAHTDVAKWTIEEFAKGFASALEAMAGARPASNWEMLADVPAPIQGEAFGWKQSLSSVPGEIYLLSAGQDITAAGNHVMVAVGVEDSSAEELRSTFLELVNQAFAMLARSMTARLGREVLPANGRVDATAANPASLEAVQWGSIQFTLGELTATLFVGVPKGMLDAFATEAKPAAQAAAASAPGDRGTASPAAHQTAGESKTFELLLDVELPVSVSFGHALVPLKEVLKLTTGSIVELSRAIVEPVDVVVNNCVIARGEVVVVEGNFGVRIQHVVSRSDRLRTLQ